MTYDLLDNNKKQLDGIRPLTPELVESLEQWFKVELNFTTNAIGVPGEAWLNMEVRFLSGQGVTNQLEPSFAFSTVMY